MLEWLYLLTYGYKSSLEMEEMSEGMKRFSEQYSMTINDPIAVRRVRMYMDGERDVLTRIRAADKRANEAERKRIESERMAASKSRNCAKALKETGKDLQEIAALTLSFLGRG